MTAQISSIILIKPYQDLKDQFSTFYYGWDGDKYRLIGTDPQLGNCVSGDEICVVTLDTQDDPHATISLENASGLPSPEGASDDSEFDFN